MRQLSSIAIILLAVTFPSLAQPEAGKELKDFLSWYKTYRGSYLPPKVAEAYTEKLGKEGLPKQDIDARMAAVWKSIQAMPPEFAALHFDHIYLAAEAPFKTDASRFLVSMAQDRKPGRALDVGMGQGRNALYLAGKGWDVTGYDISEEGLAIANANAAKANLKIKTVLASHEQFDYGKEQWDLIVETFAFTNLADPAYRKRVVDSLKPGGMLLIEGFGAPAGKGPKNVMIEGFSNLRIVFYEDREDVADWSMRKAPMTRIAAVKD